MAAVMEAAVVQAAVMRSGSRGVCWDLPEGTACRLSLGEAVVNLGRGFLPGEKENGWNEAGEEGKAETEREKCFSLMSFRRKANLHMEMNLKM